MAIRRALIAVAVLALAASASPSTADPGIEAQVMAKIRANRPGKLVLHSGLLAVARQHSMGMSNRGRMGHENADARIRNAPPDPAEANGAPDDGFPPAAWCENVTYSTGHPASEVAQRIYRQWEGSGAHGRCMRDASRNVGAVGVHYDGTTWWATFIAQVDNTPPGGTSGGGAPTKTAAPKPQPVAAAQPSPPPATAAPTVAPAPVVAAPAAISDAGPRTGTIGEEDPSVVSAPPPEVREAGTDVAKESLGIRTDAGSFTEAPVVASIGYGSQEVAAIAAVGLMAFLLLWRRSRPSGPISIDALPEVVRRDHVPLPEVELVGAGTSHT